MAIDNNRSGREGFPRRFFSAAFVISLLTIIFSGWHSWQLYGRLEAVSRRHVATAEALGRIQVINEMLTLSARMAVATGDSSHEERYEHFDPIRTQAIDALRAALAHTEIAPLVAEIDAAKLALVKMEREAFSLMRQGKEGEATELLTCDDYANWKTAYATSLEKMERTVKRLIENENRESRTLSRKLVAAGGMSVLVLLLTWVFAFRSTRSWELRRKAGEHLMRMQAYQDTLTRLPNRRMLSDRLSQAMATSKRTGRYGALMYLDLDDFKPLNDTHGHAVGDLLLIEVARRITHCLREMDTVARIGGDEFVVILSELDTDRTDSAEQAAIVAEKIRAELAERYVLTVRKEGQADTSVEHHCSSSIGVVLFINHQAAGDEVIKRADMAMLQAKDAGRNRVHFA